MNRVKIQPAAVADTAEAASWYESQLAGLGIEFLLEIDAAHNRAVESPTLYEEVYPGVSRVLAHRFPYAVYFVLESSWLKLLQCCTNTSLQAIGNHGYEQSRKRLWPRTRWYVFNRVPGKAKDGPRFLMSGIKLNESIEIVVYPLALTDE